MDHVKHIGRIAERSQISGCSGRENIVEFYQDVHVDFDRIALIHEPLSINLAQAFSEGLLCPAPSLFVARTAMGVLDGLNFLHNEMHLVYAGRLFLFALLVRQKTETHLRDWATLFPFVGLEMRSIVYRLKDWPKDVASNPTQRLYGHLAGESPSIGRFIGSATVVLAEFGRCEVTSVEKPEACVADDAYPIDLNGSLCGRRGWAGSSFHCSFD